jgi:hypothetical protein
MSVDVVGAVMHCDLEWFRLYRRAILELDLSRVNARVDAASQCIRERLAEETLPLEERHDLQRYLHYLTTLRRGEYTSAPDNSGVHSFCH